MVLVDGVSHPDVAKVATFETSETQDIRDPIIAGYVHTRKPRLQIYITDAGDAAVMPTVERDRSVQPTIPPETCGGELAGPAETSEGRADQLSSYHAP